MYVSEQEAVSSKQVRGLKQTSSRCRVDLDEFAQTFLSFEYAHLKGDVGRRMGLH